MGNLLGKNRKKLLFTAGFAVFLYFIFKWIFPLIAPFILAFLIVYLCHPWLKRVQKKTHIRREILLGGILLFFTLLLLCGVWGVLSWGTVHAADIGDGVMQVQEQFNGALHDCCSFLEKKFGMNAARTEAAIWERIGDFTNSMRADALPRAARQSWEYAKVLAGIGAFLGISFISSLLLCRDYDSILERSDKNPVVDNMRQFAEKTVSLIGGYVRAQAVILFTVFLIAAAGLLIGGVQGGAILGLLAGLMDALPFIGTGIVLIPTALWQLLYGNVPGAVAAVVVYVLCIAARELLEPRLLGKQVGMYPVIMLFAVYAGVKVFGLTGIFLGPLYVVLLREGVERFSGEIAE